MTIAKEKALKISFDTGPRPGWVAPLASAAIYVAKEGDHWIACHDYEFWCGDHRGCSGPMHGEWNNQDAAIAFHMKYILAMLEGLANKEVGRCCFSERQKECAQELLSQVNQYFGRTDKNGQQDLFAA